MSFSFNGNDSLDGTLTTALDDAADVYIFCWFKVTTWTAANRVMMMLGTTAGDVELTMAIRQANSATLHTYQGIVDGATVSAIPAAKDVDGVWTPFMLRHSATSREIWMAELADNATVDITLGLLDEISIGETLASSQDFTGLVAEPAIWYGNGALTAQDIADLLAGVSPSVIAPTALRMHCSLLNDPGVGPIANTGLDAAGYLTINGGAVWSSDHPTITFPSASAARGRMLLTGVG